MEESNEEHRVVAELYFLIAKFLSGGPLKETAKTLLKELESVEVLPRRLDWEGNEHAQSYDELASQYSDVSWTRLASVCERALQLARKAPLGATPVPGGSAAAEGAAPEGSMSLSARLSLLSESLVRPPPKYSAYKEDHSLVRRLAYREVGLFGAGVVGGRGGVALMSPRLLSGLRLQRRTLGHLSAVYCVVFDRTGRYVITGADDLLVKVWSARDGRLLATLRGCGAEITDACVSADSALLAAGSVERLVRVWCLATGAPRAVLAAHAGTITSVHWAPPSCADVRWLASTSTDGSVAFWTCSADGQFLSQPVQYVERMRPGACHMICAAWSAGGGFLAAGSADQHVRVYAVSGAAPRRVLEVAVHSDAVDSIAWAHRGLRFVSGSKDGSAALWTLHATQWRHTLLRCTPLPGGGSGGSAAADKRLKVTMVCWDCSDAYVLTAVSDNTVRVWCSIKATLVSVLRGHRDEAYVLEPHPALAGVALSAGHDGQLHVWHAPTARLLHTHHNTIPGQGEGAIFDAKWGGVGSIAATDSHGHLLLLGLGRGHRLLGDLPQELFFHTDYRPLVRDALGGALDEQTETPPHLMPPPFLVDVEGAPHAPRYQRLVPGRENLAPDQLVPVGSVPTRLDLMISALAGERGGSAGGGGPWRGEGVRHTVGAWSCGAPAPHCSRPIVTPAPPALAAHTQRACAELNALEQAWWRREMRRRPVMISTAGDGPRRKPGRRPQAQRGGPPRPGPAAPAVRVRSLSVARSRSRSPSCSRSGSGSADWSELVSDRSSRTPRSPRRSSADSDSSCSYTSSKTDDSSESSYSDWEAGEEMAPPARARRRPLPARRYSPSSTPSKRVERAAASAPSGATAAEAPVAAAGAPVDARAPAVEAPVELPDAYRPGEWLCAVSPRKAPYHPQMGDLCLYFRLGHQRYFEAVAEKDVYKVNPRDKPWTRTVVHECELVKVIGIKYVIKPPRIACVRLACVEGGPTGGGGRARSFTVRYHDMPDVIDFLVLKQQYDVATQRHWGQGDRFRCMIDDSWWTGVILERTAGAAGSSGGAGGSVGGSAGAAPWAACAAAHFLSLRVRWDNGEVERLSPWDLEPLDPERLPAEPGGSVPVLAAELEAALYRAEPDEWPPHGDRAAAARSIAQHISQVMTLSVAEPFVAPVDLQQYPAYAMVVPYPIDLATIRARFQNLFYRRTVAAQFDVRYLASNAEQFNEPHSPIVRQARLVTDLLLHIISNWVSVDVVGKYHELAASYHSSDDEPLAHHATKTGRARRRRSPHGRAVNWRAVCADVLRALVRSADAAPFLAPVSAEQAPDYRSVVPRPLDLGTIQHHLTAGRYSSAARFAADVRRVFSNSRLYNTNKRSRIYSMTVRLSALFESLWTRACAEMEGGRGRGRGSAGGATGAGRRPRRAAARSRRVLQQVLTAEEEEPVNGSEPGGSYQATVQAATGGSSSCSSESEPLAATSRRVHAAQPDSWDSDAPLHTHRKGKGVGKKSKSNDANVEPAASTSRQRDGEYIPEHNGVSSSSDEALSRLGGASGPRRTRGPPHSQDSAGSTRSMGGLDEDMDDDSPLRYNAHAQRAAKRRRARSSGSSQWSRRARRKRAAHTRTRERYESGSSSSSSSPGCAAVDEAARGRYESDHSFQPHYSTDEDAPLQFYRQRASSEAGPSGSRRHHRTRGGVSLRSSARGRVYNEDSEEDSVACISKRLPPHQLRRHQSGVGAAHTRDHTYSGGGSVGPAAAGGSRAAPAPASRAHDAMHAHHSHHNGTAETDSRDHGDSGAEPVSVSSRGRVRKLTAKARGLLRH